MRQGDVGHVSPNAGEVRAVPGVVPVATVSVPARGSALQGGRARIVTLAFRRVGDQRCRMDANGPETTGGELLRIWIKRARRGPMDAVEAATLIAGQGIEGNADQGGWRQVTVIDEDAWQRMMDDLEADVDPAARRANLLVRGIDLRASRGRTLQVGSCRIEIRGETRPCERMDEALPGLRDAMRADWNGGIFGRITEGGEIRVGDSVTLT